ncbi:MAG: ribonuclease HI [Ignavibacteriales bacterium]|nr:ribonuclease HI [Ignavibacteriales bacterium]
MTDLKNEKLTHVKIYTDGACIGNPGRGGYGIILIHGKSRKEISGGFRLTTNNRMELMAAIVGLETLKYRCSVTIYTDSQYLADSVNLGWLKKWRAKGWMRNKKEPVINPDLWEKLLTLCDKHDVEFEWVKGHSDNLENECCDILSYQAAQRKDLPVDEGYECKNTRLTSVPNSSI